MDEYLFITMAKLKADRLRLKREEARQIEREVHAIDARAVEERPHPLADSSGNHWNFVSR